jgi:hypothetical protein
MDGEKVQVLTAGGAANVLGSGKRKKKRRNVKKNLAGSQEQASVSGAVATAATSELSAEATIVELQNAFEPTNGVFSMEFEQSERDREDVPLVASEASAAVLNNDDSKKQQDALMPPVVDPTKVEDLYQEQSEQSKNNDLIWLFLCFIGIMASFVCYGLLMEYTTSGGRELHELSFLFVTSGLYTLTAAAGRYVRAETPTTIPPARFAILGLTSMGSTFCSVRSLR